MESINIDSKISGKVIVVGDGACGKTCLLEVLKKNKFPEDYIPTVVDNFVKDIIVDDIRVSLTLWDTADQEEYDSARPLAYRDSDLVLLCYTIENKAGLTNLTQKWMPEIRNYRTDAGYILVGLKCDIRNKLDEGSEYNKDLISSKEEAEAIKEQIGAAVYIECSAKEDYNVTELFDETARWMIYNKPEPKRKRRCLGEMLLYIKK